MENILIGIIVASVMNQLLLTVIILKRSIELNKVKDLELKNERLKNAIFNNEKEHQKVVDDLRNYKSKVKVNS